MANFNLDQDINAYWVAWTTNPATSGATFYSSGGSSAGTSDPDTIYGSSQWFDGHWDGGNYIAPDINEGKDTISGAAGDDYIDGRTGNDIIQGNAGNDNLFGGDGNDTIYGGMDSDTIQGNAGADFLLGDAGVNYISGGSGADTFYQSGAPPSSGFNHTYVSDFDAGAGDSVQVGTTSYVTYMTGSDTIVDFQNNSAVILVGVNLSSLPSGWIHT